jgi:hypothetical protein
MLAHLFDVLVVGKANDENHKGTLGTRARRGVGHGVFGRMIG